MIPERIAQFLKNRTEPDFFDAGNRAACNEIHDQITQYVNEGTEVLTFSVDAELLVQAESLLKSYGWTLEEATVLFLMWCITCPDEMETWVNNITGGNINEENPNAVQT